MSEAVRTMFAEISGRYDLMNSVITFGMHHAWRRRAVRLSKAQAGDRVLDCAAGTGDLALAFKKVVGPGAQVIATDFCEDMLEHIPAKAQKLGLDVDIAWADAMHLDYADQSFDITSIAYGIRNVDNPRVALGEMIRVLKDGGRLVVLETGQPRGFMSVLFKVFRKFIPLAGRLIAGHSAAYEYLPETASRFPSGDDFVAMIRENPAVRSAEAYSLFFGVSYIYIATIGQKRLKRGLNDSSKAP